MKSFLFAISVLLLLASCDKKAQLPSNKYAEVDSTPQKIMEMNTMLGDMEEEDIKKYTEKSGKDFRVTGTGVRIWIQPKDVKEKGDSVRNGDVVEVNYRIKLTDGTVLYDLTGRNADVIEVGKERRQTGFAEGLTLLREGDRAIIVVPSILAYGALGDRDKIPPRATLVYDVIGVSKTGKNR